MRSESGDAIGAPSRGRLIGGKAGLGDAHVSGHYHRHSSNCPAPVSSTANREAGDLGSFAQTRESRAGVPSGKPEDI